ncbi:MAG: PQQ-binding-like beta-propeller repeat protein [Candidatus Aureabacteria bacterium]|nr:PQQ-binding-like beta-propeller repeat protein [Candidatus Auribacterota bacterium]
MKKMMSLYAWSCFSVIAFLVLPLQAQPDPCSPWPMFHRDTRNTGQSDQLASQNGKLLWSYTTGGGVSGSACSGSDGTIYFGAGAGDNTISALSFEGGLLWSYRTGNGVQGTCALSSGGSICGSSGSIYCGSNDNRFYALTRMGSFVWSYRTEGANDAPPSEGDDGTIYFGSTGNRFYAVSNGGSLKWSYATGGAIHGCASLGDQGDIYFGALDHRIYSVRSAGSLLWSYCFEVSLVTGLEGGVVIGSDGALYFGTTSIVTALTAMESSGTVRWTYYTDDSYGTPALSNGGTIYFGSDDNEMWALNSHGTLQWSYSTGDDVRNGTAAIGSDGMVYAASRDGGCYAMDSSGALRWSYRIGDSDCAPSIGYSGTLYVGSFDNVLYSFKGQPTATPTQTPTPTETAIPPCATTTCVPPTPVPNYVELRVQENKAGVDDFYPGDKLVLQWRSYENSYNYASVPCAVYFVAALHPPIEDAAVTVNQILSSKELFIFDSKMRPVRFNPKSVQPTFNGVSFPIPGMGSSGSLSFTSPSGSAGRWVFAMAFVMMDNGDFPSNPPVEVSNGVSLH